MLDQDMIEQLKEVFSKLENPVSLKLKASAHTAQAELEELLTEVAGTSPKIQLERLPAPSEIPSFEIWADARPTGIRFRAVPGGHEFSSLILAILHADKKGRQPDQGIISRIQNLKGPVRVRTYMSLSCENCPEVVQALNLMASHHADFEHETIDGALTQDEVTSLGIQGVPAVIVNGKLLHSGKAALSDLLAKLEEAFGKKEATTAADLGTFDVAVIGGGPAGASAAIYSVRKGLKTAIIADKMGGQLQETKGIENMISIPYTEGVKLSASLTQHLGAYPVQVFEHRRVREIEAEAREGLRELTLESGEKLRARNLIVATGAKWRELGIPGEKEHIGLGVAFCAHCDGPFYKGKRVVVVGGGNSGVEAAIDLSNIATDVTLLEFGDKLKADTVLVEKARALSNVRILTEAKSTRVIGDGAKVSGLEYEDRTTGQKHTLTTDGVFVQIGLLPNSQCVKGLVETTPYGEIVVDAKGRTSAPGIYAAGDVTTVPFKQIVIAMGEGAKVALTAFEDRMRN